MAVFREEIAGQHSSGMTANKYLERVEQIKCLGTTPTSQNSFHEEIKNRSKSRNALLSFGAEFLSSSLLSKKEDWDIHNYTFACCFVWVCNLVARTEGETWAEGV